MQLIDLSAGTLSQGDGTCGPVPLQNYVAQLEEAVRALPGFAIPLDDEAAQEKLREALSAHVLGSLRALGVDETIAVLLIETAFLPTFARVVEFHRFAGHA